ncbi:MAG TPA: nuclear transport factor 2 family protein [Solirubrobacteraceae bacterium]|nr:nuclear transport factor 2 family protein [Solirubrobacteraceae bacterium]
MSAKDSPVDLTRRSFAAAGSGDYDLMMSFYGRDSVFDMSGWGLGVHTGSRAIRRFFESWIGSFAEFSMELEEVADLGSGVTFAVARQDARSSGAREPLSIRHAAIAVWQGGVAVRVTNYRDIEQARKLAVTVAQQTQQALSA